MDDKYNISKAKKPETKQEFLQQQIEELIKQRDRETEPGAKATINSEIKRLFAQWERLKL